MHMHVLVEKNYDSAVSLATSGKTVSRFCQAPSGSSDCIRSWARSHAGAASCNFAVPESVMETSFSRRSAPGRTATQPCFDEDRKVVA